MRSFAATTVVALLAAGTSSAYAGCCSEQGSACTAPYQTLVATFDTEVACCDSEARAVNYCEHHDGVWQGVINFSSDHDPSPGSGFNYSCANLAAGQEACKTASPTTASPLPGVRGSLDNTAPMLRLVLICSILVNCVEMVLDRVREAPSNR
jgi:hypothetical protein